MATRLEVQKSARSETEQMILCMRDLEEERLRLKNEHAAQAHRLAAAEERAQDAEEARALAAVEAADLEKEVTKLRMAVQHEAIGKQRVDGERESWEARHRESEAKLVELRRELLDALRTQEQTVAALRKEMAKSSEQSEKAAKMHEA